MAGLVGDIGTVQGGKFGAAQGAEAAKFLEGAGIATKEQTGRMTGQASATYPNPPGSSEMRQGTAALDFLREQGIASAAQVARQQGTAAPNQTTPSKTPDIAALTREAVGPLTTALNFEGTSARSTKASGPNLPPR